LIRDFYSGQANLRCLNSSFITLVSKNQPPAFVNDYRPILGGPIKILTKLLANRVQKVITQMVHCNTLIFRKIKTCQVNAFHLNSNRKFSNNLIGCISWHAYFYFLALG
jgi:hypothetical protein